MVGGIAPELSPTLPLLFLRKLNSTPNSDFEKVSDGYAVIQAPILDRSSAKNDSFAAANAAVHCTRTRPVPANLIKSISPIAAPVQLRVKTTF